MIPFNSYRRVLPSTSFVSLQSQLRSGQPRAVLDGIVETYAAAPSALKPHNADGAARAILRDFADACRAELTDLRLISQGATSHEISRPACI